MSASKVEAVIDILLNHTVNDVRNDIIILQLLLNNNLSSIVVATILFLVASITDYLDGYLAKKYGLVSNFGKIMDPIADKALMLFFDGAKVINKLFSACRERGFSTAFSAASMALGRTCFNSS